MSLQFIDYHPINAPTIGLAVATTLTSGEVSTVRIYIRSRTTLSSPTTYITDNSLEHVVVSQAGLDEGTIFASYALVSSELLGDYYLVVIDATVSSA
jgi:hypothetical protein